MDALVKIKKIYANAILPVKSTEGSAGYDLFAHINEPEEVLPNSLHKISTGIAIALPHSIVGFIFGRSGLGIKHGIVPSDAVGVIDSDYRGELFVGICNVSDKKYTIQPNERIAQLVLMPYYNAAFSEKDQLEHTNRGSNGLGSSGKF